MRAAGWLMPGPFLVVGLWAAVGCESSGRYLRNLESPDPGQRIRAIKQAGDRRDRSASPALVQRLEDEDEAVRLFAILALEKIWGTRLGYDYRKPPAERDRAVRRWRRHLETSVSVTTRPDGGRVAEASP